MIGGYDGTTLASVEIMNTDGSNCKPIPDLPMERNYAVSSLINNKIVICGGKQNKDNYFDECLILNGDSWKHFATMKSKRSEASLVQIDESTIWISGGIEKHYYSAAMKISEFINKDGQVTKGPELEQKMAGHCSVKTSNKHIIVTGGRTSSDTLSNTYVYYQNSSGSVTFLHEGPKLNEQCQRLFACQDQDDLGNQIVEN